MSDNDVLGNAIDEICVFQIVVDIFKGQSGIDGLFGSIVAYLERKFDFYLLGKYKPVGRRSFSFVQQHFSKTFPST